MYVLRSLFLLLQDIYDACNNDGDNSDDDNNDDERLPGAEAMEDVEATAGEAEAAHVSDAEAVVDAAATEAAHL